MLLNSWAKLRLMKSVMFLWQTRLERLNLEGNFLHWFKTICEPKFSKSWWVRKASAALWQPHQKRLIKTVGNLIPIHKISLLNHEKGRAGVVLVYKNLHPLLIPKREVSRTYKLSSNQLKQKNDEIRVKVVNSLKSINHLSNLKVKNHNNWALLRLKSGKMIC